MTKTTKIKAGDLEHVLKALNNLAGLKLPPKACYRIAKNIMAVQPEYATVEKARVSLCQQHGKLHEDGTRFIFEGDAQAEFSKGLNELFSEDVEIKLATLAPDDLGSAEIEPSVLLALIDTVIVEPEAEKAAEAA